VSVVRAAGGVPVRETPDGRREVLVIHRPQYGDWSFPKGKCEPGESDEACAIREVEEETGLVCVLGDELPSTSYTDSKGRPKRVRYWRLHIVGGGLRFVHEADDARWVSAAEAEGLLSYDRDLAVLRATVGIGHLLEDGEPARLAPALAADASAVETPVDGLVPLLYLLRSSASSRSATRTRSTTRASTAAPRCSRCSGSRAPRTTWATRSTSRISTAFASSSSAAPT